MSLAQHTPMTLLQFLEWEELQEMRFEFDGERPVAMAGGTAAHAAIQVNLIAALRNTLRRTPCRPFGSELKIEVAGRIRYPEAFVVCTPVLPRTKIVTDPVVVFEVLGDGTANDDLVVKNAEYRATPSILRYVILQQTHPGAIVFRRKGDDWVAEIVPKDGVLRMPEISAEISLDEIYADIDLSDERDIL